MSHLFLSLFFLSLFFLSLFLFFPAVVFSQRLFGSFRFRLFAAPVSFCSDLPVLFVFTLSIIPRFPQDFHWISRDLSPLSAPVPVFLLHGPDLETFEPTSFACFLSHFFHLRSPEASFKISPSPPWTPSCGGWFPGIWHCCQKAAWPAPSASADCHPLPSGWKKASRTGYICE